MTVVPSWYSVSKLFAYSGGFFFHPKKDVLTGPLRKIDCGDERVEVRFWIARDLDETIALLGGK